VAIAALVILGGALLLLLKLRYAAGDFANNLWGPAYYLVHGWSPYRAQEMLQANQPVWFPPAIGLFFPLGWLDLQLAANLWFLANLALVVLLLYGYREGSSLPLAAALLTILFPPLLMHLWLGQYTLLAVALFFLSTRLVTGRRFLLAGLLIAPILAKPQLAVLALPGLWIAALRTGGRRGALLFPAAVAGGALLLTVPLWIAYPNWLPDMISAQQANPSWLQPTLYTVLGMLGGPAGLVAAGLVAFGVLALNLWLWGKYPPEEVLPWSLALTTLATPYLWSWDMVLFLPLVIRSVQRYKGWAARFSWVVGYLGCWIALVVIRLLTDGSDHRHFWVPWFFFLLVLVGYLLERRTSLRREPLPGDLA
jgi:hypothetical protein